MISVETSVNAGVLKVVLKGAIDETFDFAQILQKDVKELHINCRHVTQINSLGIKNWKTFFHSVRCSHVKLRFEEISPVLVSQLNYILDFITRAEAESICLPFFCTVCNNTIYTTCAVAELKPLTGDIPDIRCPTCNASAYFDEIPTEYLSFVDDPNFI